MLVILKYYYQRPTPISPSSTNLVVATLKYTRMAPCLTWISFIYDFFSINHISLAFFMLIVTLTLILSDGSSASVSPLLRSVGGKWL